ncbi:hypothetical protein KIY80_gp37 [Mycobacterium phage Benvolio]|uniref:Uncharacterized protein n=1 Tax=Mycobacterium phage Benvolio TaxID=2591074 RepID=A0A514A3K1_9CAUD|nr:hypothetical protein CH13_gp040 [Mycobacterium phage Echild]YP_010063474.1 hypothetical protein KIY80_gp37 [Mycobacterium phage Benvolio]AHG24261.1 hypothetical protein PBI_ECHILD_40 [Mycobacterium phage Echild]QDH47855.1 hypothetical protein SEA_BENVOLIO_37 [Mycobacterium phage Benvolio]
MTDYRDPEVVVTDKAVYFDGYELPWYITENGIDFKPGGHDDFNRLRIEFIVGTTTFSDSAKQQLWEVGHDQRWKRMRIDITFSHKVQLGMLDRLIKEYM